MIRPLRELGTALVDLSQSMPFTASNVAWVRSTWDAFSEFGTGGIYLNFTGLDDEAPSAGVDSAFGRNMRRLAEVKASYDPENFFRLNNNISPASS